MHLLFITGTDTGVGKTFFAARLAEELKRLGADVVALKPVCSGSRDDARKLRAAAGGVLPLDAVNPWHFRAALSPALAARKEKRRVTLPAIVKHVLKIARQHQVTLIEGAGGLLSPLGAGFDSRDLLRALAAKVIVVCPNRLGAVGQCRLVLDALPKSARATARIVLVNPPRKDAASRSNRDHLADFFPADRIHVLPWERAVRSRG